MAQTKKKRRRKHSGTQAGTIQRQPDESRPRSKEERREEARRKRLERLDTPPTIRGSLGRAAVAALVFVAIVIVAFGRSPAQGLALGVFMFALYIPIGYYTDLFIYRRRQRKQREQAGQPPDGRGGGGKARTGG